MTALAEQYATWREQVDAGVDDHYAHGKTPRNLPASEVEWKGLFLACPRAIYAAWFVLTGKRHGWPAPGRAAELEGRAEEAERRVRDARSQTDRDEWSTRAAIYWAAVAYADPGVPA